MTVDSTDERKRTGTGKEVRERGKQHSYQGISIASGNTKFMERARNTLRKFMQGFRR
jgi:hypothetical protein